LSSRSGLPRDEHSFPFAFVNNICRSIRVAACVRAITPVVFVAWQLPARLRLAESVSLLGAGSCAVCAAIPAYLSLAGRCSLFVL
jgi:hypothetical protein